MTKLFERGATRRYGDTALARWMIDTAPREGGAPWNPSEIRRWLSNRVYLGEVRYGQQLQNLVAHEPLTEEDIWQRCQREPGDQRKAHSPFLLRGLIRCAACRYAMGGQTNGGRGGETPVYRCPRGQHCPEPTLITADRIEEYLVDQVIRRQHGVLLGQTEAAPGADAIEAYDAAVEEVEIFVGDVEARRLMGDALWRDGLAARITERERLKPARDAALARLQALRLAQRSASDLDRHDLRDLLTSMIRCVFVRRGARGGEPAADRSLIVWADDPRVIDLPRRHNRVVFEPIRW